MFEFVANQVTIPDAQRQDPAHYRICKQSDVTIWKPDRTLLINVKRGALEEDGFREARRRYEENPETRQYSFRIIPPVHFLCLMRSIEARFDRLGLNFDPFTQVTVNVDRVTGPHADRANIGYSGMATMLKGEPRGCELLFPRWGCGVALQHGDVCVVDLREEHCNGLGDFSKGSRINFVFYRRPDKTKALPANTGRWASV